MVPVSKMSHTCQHSMPLTKTITYISPHSIQEEHPMSHFLPPLPPPYYLRQPLFSTDLLLPYGKLPPLTFSPSPSPRSEWSCQQVQLLLKY